MPERRDPKEDQELKNFAGNTVSINLVFLTNRMRMNRPEGFRRVTYSGPKVQTGNLVVKK